MKKKTANILVFIMLLAGVVIGSHAFAASTQDVPSSYKINENGQTYGGVDPYSTITEEEPDLIAAIGIDGTEGYVYSADLYGNQPSTPDEAILYMENLEREKNQARAVGEEYLRYIPLYASDGVTVIGEFGISY